MNLHTASLPVTYLAAEYFSTLIIGGYIAQLLFRRCNLTIIITWPLYTYLYKFLNAAIEEQIVSVR